MVSEIKEISHPQLLQIEDQTITDISTKRIAFSKNNDYQRVTFNELDGISH